MKRFISILALLLISVNAHADVVTTKTTVVSAAPVVDTAAYATGELIGGKLTLTNATALNVFSGIISNVVIIDNDSELVDLDVVFFSADPTATTFTDQAAFDPADADALNIICTVSVTTDVTFADNGMSYANNQNCPFRTLGSNTIYAAIVSRGSPTYTASNDLLLKVGILQD